MTASERKAPQRRRHGAVSVGMQGGENAGTKYLVNSDLSDFSYGDSALNAALRRAWIGPQSEQVAMEFSTVTEFTNSSASLANNARRIVLTGNQPIDREQAGLKDDEGGNAAEQSEENNRIDREQDRAEDVRKHLAGALRLVLPG
ncbi:hypothetical protein IVA79_12480 [Bradyrhizobium sp. 138]|uniref:hypothetical protein n=1 Tax=Bradyrhizobium sp. 138 TaxID=2782615 RepID=UPI001FFA33BA|nr:hypothetical protein [Bradyrhizobium sp. 138]MCK1734755.1 hypothetical protein [Bradyrhizobium sp. 138]